MSEQQKLFTSIFSLINSASKADPERLKYRFLFAPKQIAKVVENIEDLKVLRGGLDEDQQKIVDDMLEQLDKALISTTSIKGQMLSMLTTSKSIVQISDPRAKKQVLGNLMRGGQGGFDQQA